MKENSAKKNLIIEMGGRFLEGRRDRNMYSRFCNLACDIKWENSASIRKMAIPGVSGSMLQR
jgi:hypothetical protein